VQGCEVSFDGSTFRETRGSHPSALVENPESSRATDGIPNGLDAFIRGTEALNKLIRPGFGGCSSGWISQAALA
jgi:hypothetical protein